VSAIDLQSGLSVVMSLREYSRRCEGLDLWNGHHTPNIAFLTRSDVISLLLTRLEIKALLDDPDESHAISRFSSEARWRV